MKPKRSSRRWVVCVKNKGYAASLELRKLYRTLPDADAERHRLLRVVDEDGDDYLYPQDYFVALDVPAAADKAISVAS
jgi:hypothetical protein